MAVKLKIPRVRRKGGKRSRFDHPLVKSAAAAFIIVSTILLGIFAYYYVRYERMVDQRMRGPIFNNASKIYARPRQVRVGERVTAGELANYLRRAGYTEQGERGESPLGTYRLTGDGIEVRPGSQSYHQSEGALIRVKGGKVEQVLALGEASRRAAGYELEPQLLTALFDSQGRTKRRLVSYDEVPKVMVDAVLAIEDRRFFDHSGVNFFRLARAAWSDLLEGSRRQGGSTITMQIARGFFLTPEKTVKRKATEILIAFQLEQRFSKKQIFELYANQVPMGQRGSFAITGLAEAARSYFGKDLKEVTAPESALLAGLIQRPSYLNPYRHPQRALERRNLVLDGMVEIEALTPEEAERAKATPLKLAPPNVEASDAPYFVDLVKDTLLARYSERELNEGAYRVYTTLDPELQRAAAEAVQIGIKQVDQQLKKLRTRRVRVGKGKFEEKVLPGPEAQVALVCIDPRTGEVLALVGGRNYAFSQLNHAVARRPTGSIFKPFVYAAAINHALNTGETTFTPATLVDDSPTTFIHGDEIYEPRNYKDEYHGPVTARYALAHSLNNATVRMAEMVGYEQVVQLARASGIKSVQPTPAVALGAYEATPLEMAGAYTVFANGGVRVAPSLVRSVTNPSGGIIEEYQPGQAQVLDPRVAYVMTTMMEAVVNSGTGAGVRALVRAPAAGKTGTSHDGWFAGYTSNLLTVVWIGFDDYTDLRLSGAYTAAPIWAEFMKRALELPQYSDARPFQQPPGVVDVVLDRYTNRLATPSCPQTYQVAFIAGTEPTETCDQTERGIFRTLLGLGSKPLPPPVVSNPREPQVAGRAEPAPDEPEAGEPVREKKKGFFSKIFGVFKSDKDGKEEEDKKEERPPPPPGSGPGAAAPHR